MKESTDARIFGLDLLRSLAIVLVVVAHSDFNYIRNIVQIPLPDGVDLFFVLSGYLVGTILIKTTEQQPELNWSSTLNFLKRRWFRTLPNYFLFLLINILLVYFGIVNGYLNKYIITFFVFFQNFHKPYDFLFWESWSLSVEEWFYLTFPLMLLLLFTLTKYTLSKKSSLRTVIIFFLVFPFLYRFFQFHFHPSLDFDLYFRKLVLCRLDTIGFGLAGAYLHWYHKDLWKKSKVPLFMIGLVSIFLLIAVPSQNMFFSKVVWLSLVGLSVLLVVPFLESLKREKIPLKPFETISKLSYSMYLIHMPLVQVMNRLFVFSNRLNACLIYIVFWIVLLLTAKLIYHFYEKPLTNLRDRKDLSDSFKN